MRADRHLRRVRLRAAALLACLPVLFAACTQPVAPQPEPAATTSSASPTPRVFTLVTTGPVTTADPAVALGYTDSLVVTSVYQRLMVVLPDTGELEAGRRHRLLKRPPRLVYASTLPDNLYFHNGHVLDSSDEVQHPAGTAARRRGHLDRVAVGFRRGSTLTRTPSSSSQVYLDNRFSGYALAEQGPRPSWTRRRSTPDTALLETLSIGSGPYEVQTITDSEVTVSRFDKYVGPKTGLLDAMKVQIVADSAAAEAAINDGTADAVWRGLRATPRCSG